MTKDMKDESFRRVLKVSEPLKIEGHGIAFILNEEETISFQ
jgi:hypothetical protein